jgi:transposase
MSGDFKKTLKKAKEVVKDVVICVPEPKKFKKPLTKKQKEELENKRPTSNELIEIPYKVEAPYSGRKREEDLDVHDPVHILVQKVRDGELEQIDLGPDDKFVIIRHLKETEGLSNDEIAAELKVSRKTVLNYVSRIKQIKAQALADNGIWEIGGELYDMGLKAMEQALRKGRFQQFAYVMSTMVTTLQSMGLIFKMPKQSQVQQKIVHDLTVKRGNEGFKQIKHIAEQEEINLDNVFNEILGAVKEGKLDEEGD